MQVEPYSTPPYGDWTALEISDFVKNGRRLEIPSHIPSSISALIQSCCSQDPKNRPKFTKIVNALTQVMDSNQMMDPNHRSSSSIPSTPEPARQNPKSTMSPSETKKPTDLKFSGNNSSNEQIPNFKPNETIPQNYNVPISASNSGNIPIPLADLDQVAWYGDIQRAEVQEKLENENIGTFLTRWSERQKSFVVSFKHSPGVIKHIDSIKPFGTKIIAIRKDNTEKVYDSFGEYIRSLQKSEQIANPLRKEGGDYEYVKTTL